MSTIIVTGEPFSVKATSDSQLNQRFCRKVQVGLDMGRKAIPQHELRTNWQQHFVRAVNDEKPLPCALITTAFIENALISLLTNFFVDRKSSTMNNLFKPGSVLGDLSKSADLAYCLGFINETMLKNIKRIGEIRNVFAHSHELIDFDHPDLRTPLSELTFPVAQQQIAIGEPTPMQSWAQTPRGKFTLIALTLYLSIQGLADAVKHQANTAPDQVWPEEKRKLDKKDR